MYVLTLRPRRPSTARGILTVRVLPQMRSIMLRPYALSAALAFASAAVTSSVASSQATDAPTAASVDVRPGDRVRVVAPEYGGTPQIGTIAAVGDYGIVLRRERQEDSLGVPFAHLGRLEVSQGRSDHLLAGLGIGLAAGALGGAVIGHNGRGYTESAAVREYFGPLSRSQGPVTVVGALVGGAAGALIGGVTGALIHTERWRTAPIHSLAGRAHAVASSQATGTPTPTSLDVRPGDRVRVLTAQYSDTAQIGTIAAVRGDSIFFRPEHQHDSLPIPFAHLWQLDVSQGRSAHPLAGLVIGVTAGALVGVGLAEASYTTSGFYSSRGTLAAEGVLVGGVPGALIGVVSGALIHTDRWRTLVPLHSLADRVHARIHVIPSSMGLRPAVRVAVRF